MSTDPLHGRWREHWGPNPTTNLDYADEYDIHGAPLAITAVGRPEYRFGAPQLDRDELIVELINARDPAEPYVIRYTLRHVDADLLSGAANTDHGVETAVRWTRIKD